MVFDWQDRALSMEEEKLIRDAAKNKAAVSQPTRLNEVAYELKTGRPIEAARGLKDRMQVVPCQEL
jgi:CRISPR/Cas system-associated exonuclease Cas4 (RecB family)